MNLLINIKGLFKHDPIKKKVMTEFERFQQYTSRIHVEFEEVVDVDMSQLWDVFKFKHNEYVELSKGIKARVLFCDELNGTLLIVVASAGASFPMHRHIQAEWFYMLEGEMFLKGPEILLKEGDSYYIAPNTPHGLELKTDMVFVSVLRQRLDLDEP